MRKRFKITMDTDKENAIIVHIGEGRVMKLLEVGAGLYIWKPGYKSNLLNKQVPSYSYLILVATNKINFTKLELVRIDEARKLHINTGIPRYKKIFKTLEKNLIRDFPLIVDDAKRCMNV